MERRTFFVKAGVLFSMPLIITEIGCDSNGDSGDRTGPTNGDSNSFQITSSNGTGHTHTVTISQSNVDNPPSNDITLNTSASGHVHQIILTQTDYENLAAGKTIQKNTTSDNTGHSHTFSIKVP